MPVTTSPFHHALPLFRSAMPGVSGVVLASPEGAPLAHDLDTGADAAARLAVDMRTAGASVIVPGDAGAVLVVFVDG